MTPERIAELKAIAKAATPGARRWEVNRKHKRVELCGGFPDGWFDKSIMTFERYGMGSAAPMFWFWRNGRDWSEPPKRADALAVPAEGREHHKEWFAGIDHPDARFLETDPAEVFELIETVQKQAARISRLELALNRIDHEAAIRRPANAVQTVSDLREIAREALAGPACQHCGAPLPDGPCKHPLLSEGECAPCGAIGGERG